MSYPSSYTEQNTKRKPSEANNIRTLTNRFLLRCEANDGLLFDREQFRLYRLSLAATDILAELCETTSNRLLSFLNEINMPPASWQYLKQLESMGVVKDGKASVDIVDQDAELINNSLSTPLRVFLNLNDTCNCSCRHCFIRSTPAAPVMPLNQALTLCDELSKLGVIQVSFSGGEPFIYPHLWTVLEHAAALRLYIAIATNGICIDSQQAQKLLNLGDRLLYINISIDGPPDVHDAIRGKNTFRQALSGTQKLIDQGIRPGVHATLNRLLIGREEEFIETLCHSGISKVFFSSMKPTGRAYDDRVLLLKHSEILDTRRKLETLARTAGMNVFSTESTHIETIRDLLPIDYCGAGWFALSITAGGDVYPCIFMYDVFRNLGLSPDNIAQHSLLKIWRHSPMFSYTRNNTEILQGPWCPVERITPV